jgi:hypothetical protein
VLVIENYEKSFDEKGRIRLRKRMTPWLEESAGNAITYHLRAAPDEGCRQDLSLCK